MAKRHHHERPHHGASHDGHYEGHESRRTQEMQDAGMIRENHAAIANMPQEVMIKPWPSMGSYLPEGLDDTISGVNRQMGADDSKRSAHNVPHKY